MDWKKLRLNSQLWDNFRKRTEIVDKIRGFFKKQDFLEVSTPNLVPSLIPESYLEVFETELSDKMANKFLAYLSTSPEMWHKKLLAAGSGNIFEITKSFRNTDIGGHFHNPEFTLLEWYRINAGLNETMQDCEALIRCLTNGEEIIYQGNRVNIKKPFEKLSVINAFKKYANIDRQVLFHHQKLKQWAKSNDCRVDENDDWETIYNLVFLKFVELRLGFEQPTFLYNFPSQFAPLAKTSKEDPSVEERFELYIAGVELADAYNELVDPVEQKQQFKKEIKLRKQLNKNNYEIDWDFIKALELGLPNCSGVALGIDRLLMILLDKSDIDEVVLFSGEEIFK